MQRSFGIDGVSQNRSARVTAIRLDTARLVLRPFTPADAHDLWSMDGDARVMRFLGNGPPPRSLAQCQATLDRIARSYDERPGFGLLHARLRDDGSFVGGGGIFAVPGIEAFEIAYRLPFACWGHGFATEMARALLAHAFSTLGLDRVLGLTWPEHVASQHVLRKIGMVAAGAMHVHGRDMLAFVARPPAR